MAESIVSDWLAEYAALEATELQSFIADHENNHEVSSALFTIINERLKYPDVSIQVTLIGIEAQIQVLCITNISIAGFAFGV